MVLDNHFNYRFIRYTPVVREVDNRASGGSGGGGADIMVEVMEWNANTGRMKQ